MGPILEPPSGSMCIKSLPSADIFTFGSMPLDAHHLTDRSPHSGHYNRVLKRVAFNMAPLYLTTGIALLVCLLNDSMAAPNKKVCETTVCKDTAKRMKAMMDTSVSPCDNVYQYACGTFLKDAKLIPPKTVTGSIYDKRDTDKELFKTILESPVECQDVDSFEMKMKTLYNSCMETDAMEKRGLADYKDKASWPTLNPNWKGQSENFQTLTDRHLKTLSEVFLKFSLHISVESSTKIYRLEVEQVESLLSEGEWKDEAEVKGYVTYYTDVAMALGADKVTAEKDGAKVVSFLKDLSKSRLPDRDQWDTKVTTNPSILEDMNKDYPYLDWVKTVKVIFEPLGINIYGSQKINIKYPKYLSGLKPLLDSTDIRTLHNVFAFLHAELVVRDATEATRKLWFKFKNQKPTARGIRCVKTIDDTYNVGLAKLVSKSRFSKDANTFMETLIKNVKEAYKQSFESSDWMDAETKTKALLKLRKMTQKIGVRSDKFEDADIDEFYKQYKVHKDTYIQDLIQNKQQNKINILKDLNKPLIDWRWDLSMTELNAYYQPEENQIVFPLGILQTPLFDQNAPGYINYGGIGFFIGHEIGHGFDTGGRLHDEYGSIKDWWTTKDKATFKKKAQCYIDQYSQFEVKRLNLRINGTTSVKENAADNIGFSQVVKAYKKYEKETPSELPLPDLGLTKEQLFYLSSAQVWCAKRTDKKIAYMVKYLTHPIESIRGLGVMQNSEGFSKAFNCQAGDYMNPAKKCKMF